MTPAAAAARVADGPSPGMLVPRMLESTTSVRPLSSSACVFI